MSSALDFLRRSQNRDGGWGYKAGGMSFVEPTAAVLLALAERLPDAASLRAGCNWLGEQQHADGGWGIAALDGESGWMTAWAAWALARAHPSAARRGADWLLAHSGVRVTDPQESARIRRVLRIDPTITGWGWQVGDAAWIFPTALALLALDANGLGAHSRTAEGTAYLLDRAIPDGGWNIGNPFMVTGNLAPTVENTALALAALETYDTQSDRIAAARAWLSRDDFTPTAFEWAWRGWYHARKAETLPQAAHALAGLQRGDGSWDGNPFTTAIALAATTARTERINLSAFESARV